MSFSIVCSENSGCPACRGFELVDTDSRCRTPIIRTFGNPDAAYPDYYHHLIHTSECPALQGSLLVDHCRKTAIKGSDDPRHTTEFTMDDLRFRCPKSMHLRSSQDFSRIYAHGSRAGDHHLLIFANSNALDINRLGLSISRKHGSAVHRNLKRRRIREAFRSLQHDHPRSFDLVVVPRQRDDSTLQDYRNSLRTLVRRLAKRVQTAECTPGSADEAGVDS